MFLVKSRGYRHHIVSFCLRYSSIATPRLESSIAKKQPRSFFSPVRFFLSTCKTTTQMTPTLSSASTTATPVSVLAQLVQLRPNGSPALPDLHLSFKLKAEEIQSVTESLLDLSNQFITALLVSHTKAKPIEVLRSLGHFEGLFSTIGSSVSFPQYVSTDAAAREASIECTKKIEDWSVDNLKMNVELFQLIQRIHEDASTIGLLPEEKRFLGKIMNDFRRNGLLLSEADQQVLKGTLKSLNHDAIDFSNTINSDNTLLIIDASELEGCSPDFIDSLKKTDDGKVQVTMKYPDYFAVMKRAKREATRRAMEYKYTTRCLSNANVLLKALQKRKEAAKLLGYQDHASFVMSEKMAKTPETALAFSAAIGNKLKPLREAERQTLNLLKRKETGDATAELQSWDYHYYTRVIEESKSVNEEQISEYFELDSVTKKMLGIYEAVLSLKFTPVMNDASLWHSDIQLWKVSNRSTTTTDNSEGTTVGYFYLDLYPRENKYSHAACFGLQPGYTEEDGKTRQLPIAVMVANFTKPTATRPSLLKHTEVVTYFHELGHVMHHLCSRVEYSRFHGTNVEGDFVEAPSQMLENWCWHAESLTSLSSHYQEPSRQLPRTTIDSMLTLKNLNVGHFYMRQLFFGAFDLSVHSKDTTFASVDDLKRLWKKQRFEYSGFNESEEAFGATTFGHIMGGYDAGYYGYLWSLVISADLFHTKFAAQPMNPDSGAKYRQCILQPGGSRDATDMIHDFLGRDFNQDAFLQSLGLN